MQVFEFHVSGIDKACGETNVNINGQPLESEWEGTEARGRGFLDVYSEREAIWSITCLYDSTPSDGSFSNGDDVVHLLRLRFDQSAEGFTISYKQSRRAAIVRFSPDVVDNARVTGMAGEWRQPSLDFDQDIPSHYGFEHGPAPLTKSLWHGPQRLLSSVSAFQSRLKKKIEALTGCHKNKAQVQYAKPSPLALVPYVPKANETRSTSETFETSETSKTSEEASEAQVTSYIDEVETTDVADNDMIAYDISTATSQNTDSTNTVPYFSAAETRSLHRPEELAYQSSSASLTSSLSPSTSAPQPNLNYKPLKIFGSTLILLSLLVWIILRCKDPRRRADWAARCEERRTKRLYKHAARKHKIKTLFWNIRTNFKFATNEALNWDEKRARVSGQEDILEDVMKNDIRALRRAHRVVSNITAAEEGQNQFEYEAESSQWRRSVSTLPGYESDGSQPPSYEASRSFEVSTLRDGSTFMPADVDSNPDSSVVSTSPRISRDGTNSDFDEKIEALSLDQNSRIENFRVYNRVC